MVDGTTSHLRDITWFVLVLNKANNKVNPTICIFITRLWQGSDSNPRLRRAVNAPGCNFNCISTNRDIVIKGRTPDMALGKNLKKLPIPSNLMIRFLPEAVSRSQCFCVVDWIMFMRSTLSSHLGF